MNPLQLAIRRLADGESLSSTEAAAAFDVVMAGDATPVQVAALLTALRVKGETPEEIAGAARALRHAMRPVTLDAVEHVVDTCGTGGGQVGTLNVSTGAAFIVAGAGVPVAKHGNRSFTSRSGSADVLEALGVRVELEPRDVPRVLAEAGLAFLFAPGFHPAMRHAAPVRRELAMTNAGRQHEEASVHARRVSEVRFMISCGVELVRKADTGSQQGKPVGEKSRRAGLGPAARPRHQ